MNWKDIPGYEGSYQVSDCGQIKSCGRFIKHNFAGTKFLEEKILKLRLSKHGYYYIGLHKEGKTKNFYIHRLVALAFLEGDNTLTVNHIDENKANNYISNLEYLTQRDNVKAWINKNPELKVARDKKGSENSQKICGQKIFDTQTGMTFPSIIAASKYMHEHEGAKGPQVWSSKIRRGTQNRFTILNS